MSEKQQFTEAADRLETLAQAEGRRGNWLTLEPEEACAIAKLLRLAAASASGGGDGWMPISTAPKDGTLVWAYTAEREGLPAFQSACAYHPDAGWCTDELRYVTHWRPMRDVWLPEPNYVQALASTPPPPADLKAQPRGYLVRTKGADGGWTFWGADSAIGRQERLSFDIEPVYTEASLSAAHAAGKAEGRAWAVAEFNRNIARLKAATEDVSDEALAATARAEALEEAAKKCNDWLAIFGDKPNFERAVDAVRDIRGAIRSLASTPPAPREGRP